MVITGGPAGVGGGTESSARGGGVTTVRGRARARAGIGIGVTSERGRASRPQRDNARLIPCARRTLRGLLL